MNPSARPQSAQTLADEIIRMVEINRTVINSLDYGEIGFRTHQGHLIEVTAARTVKLSAGKQLWAPRLKLDELLS
jgi:hypothetical protein